jgi:hypothetical protein
MRKIIIPFLLLVSCSKPSPTISEEDICKGDSCDVCHKSYVTNAIKYYNGEVLLPDYVHEDTLIVTDAVFLNYCMENYDIVTDGDIADILRVTTIIKP